MSKKLSILKKLKWKSSNKKIKKKLRNQFWMKMEMRFHKKEVNQFQKVVMMLFKLLNLKLRTMNGLSLTGNLKNCLNSL